MTRPRPIETPKMALFVRPNGEATELDSPPKRAKFRIDREQMRILRARTFARYKLDGFLLVDIARTFNFGLSTVKADVAWLAERHAAGLPTDVCYASPDGDGDDADD